MSKEEYTQVLIPPNFVVTSGAKNHYSIHPSRNSTESNKSVLKWVVTVTVISTVALFILFGVRYEGKFQENENKIIELAEDFDAFFLVLDQELGYDARNMPENEEVADLKSRRKRQVTFPEVPNSFGPEFERTHDGVPVIEQSYQLSRPRGDGQRQFSSLVSTQPTPESEGLRLYEGLLETGGRNEPKSLDFAPADNGISPLLPHHKVSAAWSDKPSTPTRLQLKTGDTDSIYDDRYGGPRISNQMTYTRSSTQNLQRTPRLYPVTNSPQLIYPDRSNPYSAGGTFHRNSRVAATAGADSYFGSPVGGAGGSSNNMRRRKPYTGRQDNIEYPPLKKLSLGKGQGENEDDEIQPQPQNWQSPRSADRRRDNGDLRGERHSFRQYLSRPPVETRLRPTTNPAGYSESENKLNVTINKSIPFGTYYSPHSSWEVTTRPAPRYQSRYYY